LARVLVVTTAAAGLVLVMTTLTGTPVAPGTAEPSPLEGIPAGWTELPEAPEAGAGAAYVWTGSEVLAWGGCEPAAGSRCAFTASGYAFDPVARTWKAMPPVPTDADTVTHGDVAWTGREAIFLTEIDGYVGGQAFEPTTETWRALPTAPINYGRGAATVWTGSELIVWGGGERDSTTTRTGAAYNPRTDSWRPLSEAPLGLNLVSGVWTGREMIVFGSLLDDRNRADTRTSVGAAYDPISDAWRKLPASDLSPQATSATWSYGRLLAWDYDVRSQAYDPETDSWSPAAEMPLEFSECYPDSTVVGAKTFAFFCGQAALHDGGEWREIRGGPLEEKIEGLDLWRFATLVPAGDVVFMPLEGITVGLTSEGEACYGCPGSPTSFWVYRPD
jgi:hypothetical protein